MTKIIKASLYRLFKDATFKITLIVGGALALLMSLIYLLLDKASSDEYIQIHNMCTGYSMMLGAISPSQNFGLTVPINLIVFTVGEYNFGTIRNKIIAGHKKTTIYFGLLFTGLIFTILLMASYIGLSTLLGFLFSGGCFYPTQSILYANTIDKANILFILLQTGLVYVFITTFVIFIATNLRSIGGSMPIVIIIILILSITGMTDSLINMESEGMSKLYYINPLQLTGTISSSLSGLLGFEISNEIKLWSIITPVYWSIIFTVLGTFLFTKRDVK